MLQYHKKKSTERGEYFKDYKLSLIMADGIIGLQKASMEESFGKVMKCI